MESDAVTARAFFEIVRCQLHDRRRQLLGIYPYYTNPPLTTQVLNQLQSILQTVELRFEPIFPATRLARSKAHHSYDELKNQLHQAMAGIAATHAPVIVAPEHVRSTRLHITRCLNALNKFEQRYIAEACEISTIPAPHACLVEKDVQHRGQDITHLRENLASVTEGERLQSNIIKIMFVASNPIDTDRIRLDQEFRTIKQRLQAAKYRDRFDIIPEWAVQYADLNAALLEHKPHIVHFAGHGNDAGEIVLENEKGYGIPVPPQTLADLFRVLKDNIRCVVLNACFYIRQAKGIAKAIDCVLGMSHAVPDDVAVEFASGFYSALGYGRNLQEAFEIGRNQGEVLDRKAAATAQITVKKGVDAANIFFKPEND